MLAVTHQLKDGQYKVYRYDQIGGLDFRHYRSQRQCSKSRRIKEEKGLLPIVHADEVPASIVSTIVDLRNDGCSWATISRLVRLSQYITRIEINDQGKKKPIGVPQWKGLTRENLREHVSNKHSAFAIVTGSLSGVTVIDCDSMDSYNAIIGDYPQLAETLTIQTAKGYHIYCAYEPGIINNSNSFTSYAPADIRNDGGVLFAPPTEYLIEGKCVKYFIYKDSDQFVAFPLGLKQDLKQNSTQLVHHTATQQLQCDSPGPQVRDGQLTHVELGNVVTQALDQPTEAVPSMKIIQISTDVSLTNHKEMKCLLDALPNEYFTDYSVWFRVGAIIFHEMGDTMCSKLLFLSYSKKSPQYAQLVTMDDVDRVWKSYKTARPTKATKATLYQACKLLNPTEFFNIQKQFQPFDFSLLNTTQFAQYFLQHYGDDYMQTSNEMLYCWNDEQSIWQCGAWATNKLLRMIGNDLFKDLMRLLNASVKRDDTKNFEKIESGIKMLQSRTFKENVLKDITTELNIQDIDFDTNKQQIDNIHFNNGVLQLNKVTLNVDGTPNTRDAFRLRTRSDYVTQVLPYAFEAPQMECVEEVEKIFREIQPVQSERDFQLAWNAYCITGHTKEQKFKLNVGYSAANGKSTEAKIHHSSFPIYTMKLHKTTFNEQNQKQHKQFIHLIKNPIRYAYIEELDRVKLDAEVLKDFVDGDQLNVEIMYGTSETKSIQGKFIGNSNHDTNLKACKGILRRALLQNYSSQFTEHPDPDNPNHFPLVKGLESMFEQDRYKRAYVWLLLPYVVQYYQKGLVVPDSAKEKFQDMAEEYDEFKNALVDLCDDGTVNDRIYKNDLVRALQDKLGKTISFNKLLPELKRLGYTYVRDQRVSSVYAPGTSPRGAIQGLKWNCDFLSTKCLLN